MSAGMLKVALLQIQPRGVQDRREHLDAVAEDVRRAADADLIVMPELWNVGYFAFESYAAEAEPLDGVTVERLGELAQEVGATLHAGSILERDATTGALHNTSVVLGPDGALLASYRKVHVFGYQSREQELVTGGRELTTFALGGTRAALSICYDLRFPELFRANVEEVALYIVPATWPAARVAHWRALLRARAIENQAFVLGCNAAGTNGGVDLGGHSVVIDPAGDVVIEAEAAPAVLRASIDLGAVARVRDDFPALRDRVITVAGLPTADRTSTGGQL